jgi:hypothetical protein
MNRKKKCVVLGYKQRKFIGIKIYLSSCCWMGGREDSSVTDVVSNEFRAKILTQAIINLECLDSLNRSYDFTDESSAVDIHSR